MSEQPRQIFDKIHRDRQNPDSAPLRSSRLCIRCKTEYAMAGYGTCPACYKRRNKPRQCPDCNGPMSRGSVRCAKCHGLHMHEEGLKRKIGKLATNLINLSKERAKK